MSDKILLVDDEPDFTHLLRLNLESWGDYEVREENSATRAVATAEAFSPDLVLMDLMMPGMSGDEVACRIRTDKRLKNTLVVFLTALVCPADDRLGMCDNAGNVFLAKGCDFKGLLKCIQEILTTRKLPTVLN